MIKLLGPKRALMLGIMLLVNLLLAAACFGWFLPREMEAQSQLSAINGEVNGLQGKIDNIKSDMDAFKRDLPIYQDLQSKGFISSQDRFRISSKIEALKPSADLIGFSYTIGDVQTVRSTDAATAGKRLIDSQIKIDKISALLDVNFFKMLQQIEDSFPPHARIGGFELKREGRLDQAKLDRIAQSPYSLINGSVSVDLLSLDDIPVVPKGQVPGTPGYSGGR